MSTPPNPLHKKKLSKPRTSIEITPGWQEDEEPVTKVEPEGPGQQYPALMTDRQRARRKIQRS